MIILLSFNSNENMQILIFSYFKLGTAYLFQQESVNMQHNFEYYEKYSAAML